VRASACFLLVLLYLAPAAAGDWQPDPAVRHRLVAEPELLRPATPSEDSWVDSLVENLRRGGASRNVIYRLSRSSATYDVNGQPSSLPVFVSRNNPNVYIIVDDAEGVFAKFIVNFEDSTVSAYGHGHSLFIPRSRAFAVIVLDRDWGIGGVPVRGDPGNPSFEERTANWY